MCDINKEQRQACSGLSEGVSRLGRHLQISGSKDENTMGRLLWVATAWTASNIGVTIRSISCGGVTASSGGVAIFTSMSKPTLWSTPCRSWCKTAMIPSCRNGNSAVLVIHRPQHPHASVVCRFVEM